jgi:ADP-dependent NAD(P)H-hydrate dehydratase / NAD(P)H-hydrate epimerase
LSDLIVSALEMQQIERSAFDQGVSAEQLMDEAGKGIAEQILRLERVPGVCVLYLGKGNNGGDAIVAASYLQRAGWKILVRTLSPELKSLPEKKLRSLSYDCFAEPLASFVSPGPLILLDGILGIGSKEQLGPELRALTVEMNRLRIASNAIVFAMDLPTGVGEEKIDPDAVLSDITLTVAFPKQALFRDDASNHVGRIVTIPLKGLEPFVPKRAGHALFSGKENLKHLAFRRNFDSHKGDFGRIGIVAGSRGLIGASILSSEAAARTGAGLITLYVPAEIYELVVPNILPEIMVKPVSDFRSVLEDRMDALAVGPGLGKERSSEILEVIGKFSGPMVIDADALNILSSRPAVLSSMAGPRLLTPHPGEMERLFPASGRNRADLVTAFTEQYPVALLLKGSRTIIGEAGHPIAYNSTGSPALATGGSGDVLTGICGALLARGNSTYDAGRLGAWLHGRSAELAMIDFSEESMLPSDLFRYLGGAFRDLRRRE